MRNTDQGSASGGRRRHAVVRRRLPLSAPEAWELVTDVRNHARWVPLTRIAAGPSLEVGEEFLAVSGPGARRGWPGIADRMVLESSTPPDPDSGRPGHAVYRKRGPVLLGTAEVRVSPVRVTPMGERSVLEWVEDVHLRGLPRALTAPLLRPVLGAMLRVVMRRLGAELEPGPSESAARPGEQSPTEIDPGS